MKWLTSAWRRTSISSISAYPTLTCKPSKPSINRTQVSLISMTRSSSNTSSIFLSRLFALTAMWRLFRGRWAYLPELSKGSASCSLTLFFVTNFTNLGDQKPLKKYHYFQDFLDAKKCSKSAKYKRKCNSSSVKIFENNRKSS